jgi:purine-binding chemotaxis protein CheW
MDREDEEEREEIGQGTSQLLICSVGQLNCAFDLVYVREVNKLTTFTPVPLADPHIEGLINLRGEVIAILNLRDKLKIPPKFHSEENIEDEEERIVIIKDAEEAIGILVDDVLEMVATRPEDFAMAPSDIDLVSDEYVKQLYKHKDKGVLPILNLRAFIDK